MIMSKLTESYKSGTQNTPPPDADFLLKLTERYKSGTPRRVDWATLAESVTIRHFRSEEFPIEQDSTAIWAVISNCVFFGLSFRIVFSLDKMCAALWRAT